MNGPAGTKSIVALSFGETLVSPSPFGGLEGAGMVNGPVFAAGVTGPQLTTRNSTTEKRIEKASDFV
jgi:hypothetical protein